MTEHFKFVGVVVGGKAPHGEAIRETMKAFEGKEVEITIKKHEKKRSRAQNSYYWAAVIESVMGLFAANGDDVTEEYAHEYLMINVGHHYTIKNILGKKEVVRTSSKDLYTQQWVDYVEKIKAWAAKFDWIVPDPVLLGYGADGDLRGKDAANS